MTSLRSQAGFTLIEMIITLALGALVTGAMTSSFLVLARVQTGLEQRVHGQTALAIAEQRMSADITEMTLDANGGAAVGAGVLRLVSADPGAVTRTSYSIQPSPEGPALQRLTSYSGPGPSDVQLVHGIASFSTTCTGSPAILTVVITPDGAATADPPMMVLPRHRQVCP